MQTIFIQIKCALGKTYEAADAAVAVDGVSEVYSTSGHYELLLKCYLDDTDDAGKFVNDNIHTLPGVKDTFTTLTFKAFT